MQPVRLEMRRQATSAARHSAARSGPKNTASTPSTRHITGRIKGCPKAASPAARADQRRRAQGAGAGIASTVRQQRGSTRLLARINRIRGQSAGPSPRPNSAANSTAPTAAGSAPKPMAALMPVFVLIGQRGEPFRPCFPREGGHVTCSGNQQRLGPDSINWSKPSGRPALGRRRVHSSWSWAAQMRGVRYHETA